MDHNVVVGSDDFINVLTFELTHKDVWRSSKNLAKTINVNEQELTSWLDSYPEVARRLGKKDNVVYYALLNRLNNRKTEKKELDYSLAMLHMIYFQLFKVLKTYALEINQKDSDSFKYFSSSLDKLETGLLLFSGKTKSSVDKLPKLN